MNNHRSTSQRRRQRQYLPLPLLLLLINFQTPIISSTNLRSSPSPPQRRTNTIDSFANWPLTLFAITDSRFCSNDLPYGLKSSWNASSPYFCTDCTVNVSNFWLQLVSVNNILKFSIIWQFDTLKTLSERLRDANHIGEGVTWIVTTNEGVVTAMRGIWRFSSDSIVGIELAQRDFCFGAGNYVDGVTLPPLYGHCSQRRSVFDSCGALFENGYLTNDDNVESRMYATPRSWVQVGADLDGRSPGDEFGYSTALSPDGTCLVVGAPWNDGCGGSSGAVSVYRDVNGTWAAVGGVIHGEKAGDLAGYSVAASRNCERVAFGSIWSDGMGEGSGSAKVFKFVDGEWVRVGEVIDGDRGEDYLGWSMALSEDGNRLAVGAHGNDDNGLNSGQVRVLEYIPSSGAWERLGQNILGEMPGDSSGWSVSLSGNGERVIIGAQYNDPEGLFSGHARVFEFNANSNTWVKLGDDIDGESSNDYSGASVSISYDGNRIAIGSAGNGDNGASSGCVRVYKYNTDSSSWNRMGNPILGESSGDESGFSVSLSSNGACVAIGARYNDGDGGVDSGHVRVHCYNGSLWSQIGGDIDGESAHGWSGNSVSLSEDGNRVAIGARYNNGNGYKSGHVRVYNLAV